MLPKMWPRHKSKLKGFNSVWFWFAAKQRGSPHLCIKGIVHPQMKIWWKIPSGHPRCRWVCFFIRIDLEKCSVYITRSPMDPLQWMGAVRMRVQTADQNNPQVVNMTLGHQLTSSEVKSCMFVRNKSIIKVL